MLSAKSDTASKIAGLEAGAAAYIEKPFSGDYLMAQIATILENRSLFRETPLDRILFFRRSEPSE